MEIILNVKDIQTNYVLNYNTLKEKHLNNAEDTDDICDQSFEA